MAYNPAVAGVTVNMPIAPSGATPIDKRSLYYDEANQEYRAFLSTAEAIAYLNTPESRSYVTILINTGGTEEDGVIDGGTNSEWWWKDNLTDGGLVLKGTGTGGGSGEGNILGGNIDS